MAGMTHHNQGHMAAVGAAPAVCWSATDSIGAVRPRALILGTPKHATAAVKPFSGSTRRPLEGSS